MPTYAWECPGCGTPRDVVSAISARNEPQRCTCGAHMQRIITAAHAMPDIQPYQAMTGDKAGQEIAGRRAHREFLKRNRLVEVGTDPVRSTKEFRPVHTRGEMAAAIKDSIAKLCVPDFKNGGLKERGR